MKSTYLIPADLEGRIDIIFNQPSADPVPIENGRRIFKIPKDGILLTSSKMEKGFIDEEYWYVDESGKRTKIEVQDPNSKDAPEKPMVVYFGATGIYGNSNDKNPLDFSESIIASKRTSDSIFSPKNQNEFEKQIMKKCGRQF